MRQLGSTELHAVVNLNQPLRLSKVLNRVAVMAQLASAQLSGREVPGSIFGDLNICSTFL